MTFQANAIKVIAQGCLSVRSPNWKNTHNDIGCLLELWIYHLSLNKFKRKTNGRDGAVNTDLFAGWLIRGHPLNYICMRTEQGGAALLFSGLHCYLIHKCIYLVKLFGVTYSKCFH